MKFHLIIIGNELLNGKIQDLNTHFLARFLHKQNFELESVQIIKDEQEQFNQCLDRLNAPGNFVFTTGGLGPTKDDKTKYFLAEYFKKDVTFNHEAYDITLNHYKRGGREYNKDKIDYHNLPLEFTPLKNPIGYAPCIYYKENDFHIVCCPGVPSEFESLIQEVIAPNYFPKHDIFTKHIIFKTWKIPESRIFFKLIPNLWEELSKFGEVSSLPHKVGVDVGVKLTDPSLENLKEKEKNLTQYITESPLNEYIWHIGPESVEEVIIELAKEKNLTIGFSESCTGGLCASRITDISGSSSVFWGSVVSYANEVKNKSLNVSLETLRNHGAVSTQTALEMAIGAREHLAVDIAVSTTGIAGPGGGSPEKPVGTVGIGVSSIKGDSSELFQFRGGRKNLKRTFSDAALFQLLDVLRTWD